MKVEAASVVVRDCWLLGHRSVVLRQEGRTTIFFCTLCGTRCFSDAALADHLNGSVHARHVAALSQQSAPAQPELLLPGPASPGLGLGRAGEGSPSSKGQQQQQGGGHGCTTGHGAGEHRADAARRGAAKACGDGLKTTALATTTAATTTTTTRSPKVQLTSVTVPLEWAGCGQFFFQAVRGAGRPVGEAWFCWQGKSQPMDTESSSSSSAAESAASHPLDYSMVVFPYSDGIGRAGFWEPVLSRDEHGKTVPSAMQIYADFKEEPLVVSSVCTTADVVVHPAAAAAGAGAPEALDSSNKAAAAVSALVVKPSRLGREDAHACGGKGEQGGGGLAQSKKVSQRQFRRDWKRRQGRTVERVCFLCYQKMVPGKNVAALINLASGKMLCASRNKRGVFHVFHSYCLVDWIAVCEANAWTACSKARKKKPRKSKKKQSAADGCGSSGGPGGQQQPLPVGGVKDVQSGVFSLFCPECQGTGQLPADSELEQPRYRLAQIYEWILEIVQARKAWSSKQNLAGEKGVMGLCLTPGALTEGPPQPRGMLHCFSTKGAEFLLFDDPDRMSAELGGGARQGASS